MFMRVWLTILLLITKLSACGTAAPTTQPNDTPTPIATPTRAAASDAAEPSTPPTIVGEITQLDQRMLVEQQPGATVGNKIVFSINDATRIAARVGDKLEPRTVGDLAVGQRVEVWAAGAIAESFPAQGTAETIIIVEAAVTPSPDAASGAPPDRDPDVVGTNTQASKTIWIDNKLVLFIAPTTQFFRRSGEGVEAIGARDIKEGQQAEVWTTEIRYGGTPQADALAVVVTGD